MKFLWGFWKSLRRPKESLDKARCEKQTEGSKAEKSGPRRESMVPVATKIQGPLIRKRREKDHIQVGLDFGTSSTKAVYSHVGRRVSKAVSFNHHLPNYPPYCLPSLAAIDARGQLLLGTDAARFLGTQEWDSGLQRFKVIVAGEHDETFKDSITEDSFYHYLDCNKRSDHIKAEDLTALYLAHAMKKCRELIEKSDGYNGGELDIAFNICMPIDHIQNNIVNDVFKKIFIRAEGIESAWRTSTNTIDLWGSLHEEISGPEGRERRVFAIPEAVAAMASYLVSLRKKPGLHAILDFGAGTTDISICNLAFQGGQSTSYWYAARNIPRGTIGVERIVAKYISECGRNSTCNSKNVYDFLKKLSETYGGKARHQGSLLKLYDSIQIEIQGIRDSSVYYDAWGTAYTKRRSQGTWENVQIFLTGGGAGLPSVSDIFSIPWWKNLHVRYPVNFLPTPDDYHAGHCNAPFHRMSVAYGLARPAPELEDYVLPADVIDQTPSLPPMKGIPDRDELYPE